MDIEDPGLVLVALGRMRDALRDAEAAADDGARLRAYDEFVMGYIAATDHESLTDRGGLTYILSEALSMLRAQLGLSKAVDLGHGALRERLNTFEEKFRRDVVKGSP
jgi:hypothetical protein